MSYWDRLPEDLQRRIQNESRWMHLYENVRQNAEQQRRMRAVQFQRSVVMRRLSDHYRWLNYSGLTSNTKLRYRSNIRNLLARRASPAALAAEIRRQRYRV